MPAATFIGPEASIDGRFLAKFMVSDGCFDWTGAISKEGYGKFYNGTKMVLAHRFSYEFFNGPVPGDLTLDHLCRNRACVNPEHLEPVTKGENVRRGLKGRMVTHCPEGHEYTEANTSYTKNQSGGMSRVCRACKNQRQREYQARKQIEREA